MGLTVNSRIQSILIVLSYLFFQSQIFAGPLYDAVYNNDLEEVKRLIAAGEDVNAKEEISARIPLLVAAAMGHVKVAALLIENGADVNAKENNGFTPLHRAAAKDHVKVAALLIEKGADVNAKDEIQGNTPLHTAAFDGHLDMATLLIKNGADVNSKSSYGFTPLHRAAAKGLVAVVELLINKDAKVNAKTDIGDTPLHLAAAKGHVKVAALLIGNGANVNAKNNDGFTPLHNACRDHVELIYGFLMMKGIVITESDKFTSFLPPPDLKFGEHVEVTELLIEKGAESIVPGGTTTTSRQQVDIYKQIYFVEYYRPPTLCWLQKIINSEVFKMPSKDDKNTVERWVLDRCGEKIPYIVKLVPDGGTDFEAHREQ